MPLVRGWSGFGHLLRGPLETRRRQALDLLRRGEYAAAAAGFEALLAGRRDRSHSGARALAAHAAQARARLGMAHMDRGEHARAGEELTRALELDPRLTCLRYWRACVFERAGRIGEAIDDLRTLLGGDPDRIEAHLMLAVCLDRAGDPARAGAALDRALALAQRSPASLVPIPASAGGILERSWPGRRPARDRHPAGDLDHAVALLSHEVAVRPAFADLRCRLGSLLLRARRPVRALAALEAAVALHPGYLEARLLAARAWLERGSVGEAFRHLEVLLARHPGYPDLHFWKGLAHFAARDHAGAAAALERATGLNRSFARAHRLLALVRHAQGRTDCALRALRRGLVRNRERMDAAFAPHWESDPSQAAGYPDLRLAVAREHRRHGDLQEAANECRAALALAPDYGAATIELAELEVALGRPAEAESLLTALATRQPRWADVHALLGRVRLLRGNGAGAERALRAALAIHPRLGAARADLGWALRAQSRHREANAEFARALDLERNTALPRRRMVWVESRAVAPAQA